MILNEQQTMIRDMARQFAQERLAPNAARWDREHHFPMEEIREMGRLGLMGINVPVEWGGAGADYVADGGKALARSRRRCVSEESARSHRD